MFNQVMCIIGSLPQYNKSITVQYTQFVIINYVSEHQLSHTVDTFYTTPTTRVNRGPMLLKLISLRHYACFRWVSYIPGTTARMPGAERDRTSRYYSNSKTITVWDVSHPRKSYSGTLSRMCNLYSSSTQNIDDVTSINCPNPSVSYLIPL